MTIPSTARKAGPLLGTGAQTAWPFTFKVFAESDIAVTIADSLGVETALVLNTDYSVALNANQDTSPGGTVTYPISGSPLASGSVLSIVGDLDYDQPLDLPSGGNFSPLALENELDRLTMQIQQLREEGTRSLRIPVTSDAASDLPVPAANNILAWDTSGAALENIPIANLATAVGYGTHLTDAFTGDGTTTQFALTDDPVTAGNIVVTVDGLTYRPNIDYSLAFAHLVFATAPSNGSEIMARYGNALPQGTETGAAETAVAAANTATTQAGISTAQAAAAAASAAAALVSEGNADTSEASALAAQVAAEAARDAAMLSGDVYATTAAGLAATASGGYFSVPSSDNNEYLILYLDNAGVAVEQKRYPAYARVADMYTKEQDTWVNQRYHEKFEFFDTTTQTVRNLTDGAAATKTVTKVANGLQIALVTGSRNFVFSTANKVGSKKTRVGYRAEVTVGTPYVGLSVYDGVNTFYVNYDNGAKRVSNSVTGIVYTRSAALTVPFTVDMEVLFDVDAETAYVKVWLGTDAPFVFTLAYTLGAASLELFQRNASTVIHSLQVEAIGEFGDNSIETATTPEVTASDRNAIAGAIGLLETFRRNEPAGWTYSIPNSYKFYQNAATYFSGIDLLPLLIETDPTVSVLYVDIATGSDTNAGTASSPLKGLKAAGQRVGAGAKVIIKAKGGLYPYDYAFGGSVGGVGTTLQVVSWDGLPVISSRHDTTLSWALDTDATYTATFTAGISNVFDASSLTSDGDCTRVVFTTSVALCKATAGTYYITGTTIYVHTFDGRAPDANVRVYKKAASGTGDNYGLRLPSDGQIAYLENIHFEGGVEPVSIYTAVGTYTQQIFAKDCSFKYAGGANGFNQTSDALIVMQGCIAAWNSQDGFNYKASSFGGAAPLAIEIDCIGRYNGYDAGGTNNGSTMHSGGSVIRVNGEYHHNQDRNVHDITNAFSWNMNCVSRDSLTDNANWGCGVGAADATKMWLDGCSSSGNTYDIETADTVSTVYTYNFTGAGTNLGTGTVTPYTP